MLGYRLKLERVQRDMVKERVEKLAEILRDIPSRERFIVVRNVQREMKGKDLRLVLVALFLVTKEDVFNTLKSSGSSVASNSGKVISITVKTFGKLAAGLLDVDVLGVLALFAALFNPIGTLFTAGVSKSTHALGFKNMHSALYEEIEVLKAEVKRLKEDK